MASPYKLTECIKRNASTPPAKRGFNLALYDSKLETKGALNAVLTITLRVNFRILNPSHGFCKSWIVNPDKPGRCSFSHQTNGRNVTYYPRDMRQADLDSFQTRAVSQVKQVWDNQLSLVPPYEFDLFDWPKPPQTPTIRPNITCKLELICTSAHDDAHAIVEVVDPDPESFPSYCDPPGETGIGFGRWNIRHSKSPIPHVSQNLGTFGFNEVHVSQFMIAHEAGHLLGLHHIGQSLHVRGCGYAAYQNIPEEYGDKHGLPEWIVGDIMGIGSVVHAIDAAPWMHVVGEHINDWSHDWIPAGTVLPPRQIKDISKLNWTLENSPYQGGFQESFEY
jgi:hypothetical protein